MQFSSVNQHQSFPELEHQMLDLWDEEGTFQKSLEQNKNNKKFVFFDGPPFANGLPHYGHIMANALKDAVTRYFTMRGYYVPRTNGWDCHGLPVEYEIEKELEISGKKEIEALGVETFNDKCRESVFRYTKEWETLFRRIGRWLDYDEGYATLENRYMESIWHVFKQIWDKDLMYQGHKSMHICPRCETPLSNFEVTQGYKDVTDFSVTSKFKIKGEENTYALAWTTTPWTLPGNCALAVHADVEYAYVRRGDEVFILAKALIEKNFADQDILIEKEVTGKDLVGLEYEALFPYYADAGLEGGENGWKIYAEDFVTTEDGTGIVHIAGGYGEDDMQTAKNNGIPIIQHVGMDGIFKEEVTEFAGKFVKGQDQNIAKYLEEKGLLFEGKNYRHSYPHCWRCDTALLNYTTTSWFVKVTDIKDRLLKNNQEIRWIPDHIKNGRFGRWLEGARDWSISRNRFWGCTLPVWQTKDGANTTCIGSIEELVAKTTNPVTEVYLIRHGETDYNKDHRWQGHMDIPINETGRKQAKEQAEKLKDIPFDVVVSSDLVRAKETAEIIAEGRNIEHELDKDLREKANGKFEGLLQTEIPQKFPEEWAKRAEDRHAYQYPGGESGEILEKRAVAAFKRIIEKHKGKKILIVSHQGTIRYIRKYYEDQSLEQMYRAHPANGQVYYLPVIHKPNFPEHFKGDLHKPYIDDVAIKCEKTGEDMHRIPEVLDCWFESGSMPYAQLHYPFEQKEEFEENFPADFIAEGLDQTRGWFYTLHVLSTILFDKPCFNNVIVNGILLAADGEKLSKRKKNYPDPKVLFESKGVDAVRFFLYNSGAAVAQDVRFSEAHVEEVVKKLLLTMWNCYSFFVTYANIDEWHPEKKDRVVEPSSKLDRWIISELNELVATVTEKMDAYNLAEATRPIVTFVDNLSNWYVRRSRRRFWKSDNDTDKDSAYTTLYTVLKTLTTLLAPFTPFIADGIFRNLSNNKSVHLESWPEADTSKIDAALNQEIALVRKVITLGHSIRAQMKIKVRQPLQEVQIALPQHIDQSILNEQADIIKEELNVKTLTFLEEARDLVSMTVSPNARMLGPQYGKDVQTIIKEAKAGNFVLNDDGTLTVADKFTIKQEEATIGYTAAEEGKGVASEDGIVVILDTIVTDELKSEGTAREIIRLIQDMRKEADYHVADRIVIAVRAHKAIQKVVEDHADYIMRETLSHEIIHNDDLSWDIEKEFTLDNETVVIGVKKSEKK